MPDDRQRAINDYSTGIVTTMGAIAGIRMVQIRKTSLWCLMLGSIHRGNWDLDWESHTR